MISYILAYFLRELTFHCLPARFVLLGVPHPAFLPRDITLTTRQNILAYLAVELALNE